MTSASLPARRAFVAIKPYTATFPALASDGLMLPQVDLRPTITRLGLAVRNQGSRGTCSVFVMTFLLELVYCSQLRLAAHDLSEEFLNYAANKVSGVPADGDFFDKLDAGYQAFGIATESDLPYQTRPVTSVAPDVIANAARWPRLRIDFLKPWDASIGASPAQVDQALAYLDHGLAIGFGGWWPSGAAFGTTTINGVAVMNVPPVSEKGVTMFDGHSVALVGYRRDTAFPGGGYVVFRNSWGRGWGDDGYGYLPFAYLHSFANDLVAYLDQRRTTRRVGL